MLMIKIKNPSDGFFLAFGTVFLRIPTTDPTGNFSIFLTDPTRNFNQRLGPRLFFTSFPDNLQGYIFLLRLNLIFFYIIPRVSDDLYKTKIYSIKIVYNNTIQQYNNNNYCHNHNEY